MSVTLGACKHGSSSTSYDNFNFSMPQLSTVQLKFLSGTTAIFVEP